MEGREERRLSARKPLSDRTNTFPPHLPRRNIPSPAPSKPNTSAGTPTKKTSHFTPLKQNQNPKFNQNVKRSNNSKEEKSRASTGSNNSPVSDSVPTISPAPAQSDKAHRAAAKIDKYDKQTRKDKEKLFGSARVIQDSTLLVSEATKLSSAVSGSGGCDPRPATVDNQKLDEYKRKDKGKMVVETPMIHVSAPFTSDRLPASSSAASGNLYAPWHSTIHSQKLDTQASKDNLQMAQVTTNNEASDPKTPPPHILSSSATSDNQEKQCLVVYKQRRSSRRKMHTDPSINLHLSCPPDKRMMKKRITRNDGAARRHSGSQTDPLPIPKKKRSLNNCDESVHAMPQDEVQKLKAYFNDVDAFELPEEVASESELE